MNWSRYSRFVGDIFGAPLAMEGLIAFFLESTFLGLWIFGRDLLSPKVHSGHDLAGGRRHDDQRLLHPRRQQLHAAPGRAALQRRPSNRVELTSIWKVLTNSTQLVTFPHTILARVHDRRRAARLGERVAPAPRAGTTPTRCTRRWRKLGLGVLIVSAVGVTARRPHPGPDHDRPAADEDGGCRGAVGHREPRGLQPVRLRRTSTRGTATAARTHQHVDPERAVDPRRRTTRAAPSRASTTSQSGRESPRSTAGTRRATSQSSGWPTGCSG